MHPGRETISQERGKYNTQLSRNGQTESGGQNGEGERRCGVRKEYRKGQLTLRAIAKS